MIYLSNITSGFPRLVTILLTITLCSCGGGTTGTSGTGELRLLGTAERQDGTAISDQPMDVLDESTQLLLLSSATDSRGNFQMTLPRPELGVIVELLGARTVPLESSLKGALTVSTSLIQKGSGELSFGPTLAASLRLPSSCTAFEVQGNQLVSVPQENSGGCDLIVELESTALSFPSTVTLIATCDGKEKVVDEDGVNSGRGQGTVSLSLLDLKQCQSARVEVSELSQSLKPILFPIHAP